MERDRERARERAREREREREREKRYHPATALTAFVHYNSACRPLLSQSGLRGGRGVRTVGMATLNVNSVKKAKYKRKK